MIKGLSSSINWITFDTKDVQKAREMLKELGPDSTVDSIGLGLPFEEISNILFPATSTLHTRLRYQIFVPGIMYKMYFESIEKPLKNPGKRLLELEIDLMRKLLENDPEGGVVGRVAREGLKYWPSQTYWGAVSTMRIFGSIPVSKPELFDDFMHKDRALVRNDDGEIEGEIKHAIVPDPALQKIVTKLFKGDQFRSDVTFKITKNEAEFLIRKLESIPQGKDSLLYAWSKLTLSKLNSIGKFMEIPQLGKKTLDTLIEEAKNYSKIAMGISYAYRYALCEHRANVVFKNFPDKREEWLGYAENNIKNLAKWISNNADLKIWNINNLKTALSQFMKDEKIDEKLIEMVTEFSRCWSDHKKAAAIAKAFAPEVKKQEEYRRRNRSHFIDPQMTITESTKGENYKDWLYDYRFSQGHANAVDLIEAFRRRS